MIKRHRITIRIIYLPLWHGKFHLLKNGTFPSLIDYKHLEMKRIHLICLLTLCVVFSNQTHAQKTNGLSKVWVADNGDGTYTNPVLYADYSDPDAIRVGDDYYLVA